MSMSENPGTPMRFLVVGFGFSQQIEGTLLSGVMTPGAKIITLPGRQQTSVKHLRHKGHLVQSATAGDQLLVELVNPVRLQTGNILCEVSVAARYANQFEASLQWLASQELLPGRRYFLQMQTGATQATASRLKYRLEGKLQIAAQTLQCNEHGVCNIALESPLIFDPVSTCTRLGQFQLLEKSGGELLAQGEIHHELRRAGNIAWQALEVDKKSRAALKNQVPKVVWMTGLSGSGKSTIANLLEKKLLARSLHSYVLDGDNIRQGLSRDLGFTAADRVENIRRVTETARLMLDAGLIVITSFISPFRAEREMARQLFDQSEFIEVFVNTTLEVCEARDPKGLYRKVRAGQISNFTGIDSPFEPPEQPELILDTTRMSAEEAASRIIDYLMQH